MKKIKLKAHPTQGLTCFHEYQNKDLKTLTVDMLYTTIGSLQTITMLEIDTAEDKIIYDGKVPPSDVEQRILNYVRSFTDRKLNINTSSNFDSDVGLASSASGYACLAGGLARLLEITGDYSEISKMARRGSFSASGSVSGGITIVRRRESGAEPYGEQVFSPSSLEDLTMVIAIVNHNKNRFNFYKEARTSPLLKTARELTKNTAEEMIKAFDQRDIDRLAYLSEKHVMINYSVLNTGENNVFLWEPESISAINGVRKLRSDGLPLFFSMNTGAMVFTYCFNDNAVNAFKQHLEQHNISYIISKMGGGLKDA